MKKSRPSRPSSRSTPAGSRWVLYSEFMSRTNHLMFVDISLKKKKVMQHLYTI